MLHYLDSLHHDYATCEGCHHIDRYVTGSLYVGPWLLCAGDGELVGSLIARIVRVPLDPVEDRLSLLLLTFPDLG